MLVTDFGGGGGGGGGVPVGKVLAGIGEGCCLLVRYLLTLVRGVPDFGDRCCCNQVCNN